MRMCRSISGALLIAVCTSLGCGTCPPNPPAHADPGSISPALASNPLMRWNDKEVPSPIWLARSEGICPRVQGARGVWVPRPLMTVRRKQGPVERYCSYVWSGDAGTLPDSNAFGNAAGLKAEPDPPVLVPLGQEQDEKWFKPLHARARARLSVPEQRDPHPAGAHVRVAVLDSAADGNDGRRVDRIGHGRAVARWIEELACGELKTCATEIVSYAALPLLSDEQRVIGIDPLDAGAVGTRGILAAKIEQATQDWLDQRDEPGGAQQLVINLSLGWSGCWEGPNDTATQLVRMAIGRATCEGVLVVAAGGNGDIIPGCPSLATGKPRHMLPGLWGGQSVSADECQRFGVNAPRVRQAAPLLLGIGAVDDADRQLFSTDHEANLVAYAQNVVVRDASGWTPTLSGTSMSAAAVSGVAAALWSYAPQLPRERLVALITSSAVPVRKVPVPIPADFICNELRPGNCPEVRRVSLCAALGQLGMNAPKCEVAPAGGPAVSSLQTMAAIATRKPAALDCNSCAGACPAQCALPPNAGDLDSQDVPWVVPQPKPPGCGTCVLVPANRLFQAQLLKPVQDLRLLVHVQGAAPGTKLEYWLGNVGTDPVEWLLPIEVTQADGARLGYRPAGTIGVWERGDIPLDTTQPFESNAVVQP